MSLTICPDCEKKISTRSEHCIYCGCPAIFYRDGKTCLPDKSVSSSNQNPDKDQQFPKFLTIRAACRETGIPETALRGMVKRNEIVHFQSGSRVYINLSKLQEYLSEH